MKLRPLLFSLTAVAALASVGASGWYLGSRHAAAPSGARSETDGRKVLYWHDPMVPGAKFDKPGKSPFMDMDLVAVYADAAPSMDGAPVVTVRPEIANSLGVRTAVATRTRRGREYVGPGYVVRDARGIAVLVDIFDRDPRWLDPGITATIRDTEQRKREWSAVVESVSTDIDVAGLFSKARLRTQRPDPTLNANTNVEVILRAPATVGSALTVPREALIRTGTRTAVIVALDNGRFRSVDVFEGAESGDFVEIKRGLKEGARVVVSGQFLIDSEASLRASFARMEPPTDAGKRQP